MAAQLYDTVWKKEVVMDRAIEHKTSSLNLLRHGILSDQAILPWESEADYEALLQDLVTEYEPVGLTEQSLVAELAQILVKRRRLRAAEKASYQKALHDLLHPRLMALFPEDSKNVFAEATNKDSLGYRGSSVSEAYYETDEDITKNKKETKALIKNLKKARIFCDQDHPMAYQKALSVLSENDQETWKDEGLDQEGYQPTCDDLACWLDDYIDAQAYYLNKLNERPIVKQYLRARAFPSEKTLQPLMRYETHLDRKFERTVAMLLKLKTLRTDPQIIFNA